MIQSRAPRILLIRFSSFGDVTQSLSIPTRLSELSPAHGGLEVHWVTRKDMAPLLESHPHITKIWTLDKTEGIRGLWALIQDLKKAHFTHIYDAHNNMRSHLISWFLRPPLAVTRWFDPPLFLRKSQKIWKRLLLFRFRINTYEMPFSGQRDLLEPLTQWGLSKELPPAPQIVIAETALAQAKKQISFKSFIALAPSAAYPLKRWPLEHFKKLIELSADQKFVCLGGPQDIFISDLVKSAPERVLDLSGKTSLSESAAILSLAKGLVTNDTGLLHVAEQLGKKTIALMGPAPFGFPSRPSTKIMELNLPCRPCSKHGQGPCVNTKLQRCLVDIGPEQVSNEMAQWII